MAFESLKDYLSSLVIKAEDKRYVLNFCKKLGYLESLQKKVAIDTGENVVTGYGNPNSQICFVFKNQKEFAEAKSKLQPHLDTFLVNLWDVWLTFVNKTEMDYPQKYECLAYELHAVGPILMYVFTNGQDDNEKNTILEAMQKIGAPTPQISHNVNINDLTSQDPVVKQSLWNRLRFLINYKTTDIKE